MNPGLQDHFEIFGTTRMNDHGWFIGKNNELFLWVPPSLRKPDWTPASCLIIPQQLRIRNYVEETVHGQEWGKIATRMK
jgi:hypothetical protein